MVDVSYTHCCQKDEKNWNWNLGTSLPYQNCMHAEIKDKIISRECLLPFTAESFIFPFSV